MENAPEASPAVASTEPTIDTRLTPYLSLSRPAKGPGKDGNHLVFIIFINASMTVTAMILCWGIQFLLVG